MTPRPRSRAVVATLAAAGLGLVELYTDPDELFAVSLVRRA